MKRGKEDSRYQPRKFVLSETDDTLKYFVKESREPKAILRISDLNVAFAPAKIGHQNSLQISFMKEGSTRHLYVYHECPEVITSWYMALRCAKLHRLQLAYPMANEQELAINLMRDFSKEGWLQKTGPRLSDGYKRRWFTLDNRKLMYHDDPLDAYPKGEIFIGCCTDGYKVCTGSTQGAKDQGFSFRLITPERVYNMSAATEAERNEWMYVIKKVLEQSLTPQDSSSEYSLSAGLGTRSLTEYLLFYSLCPIVSKAARQYRTAYLWGKIKHGSFLPIRHRKLLLRAKHYTIK